MLKLKTPARVDDFTFDRRETRRAMGAPKGIRALF